MLRKAFVYIVLSPLLIFSPQWTSQVQDDFYPAPLLASAPEAATEDVASGEEITEDQLDDDSKNFLENNLIDSVEQKTNIILSVPFVAQAPFGEWSEPRFQDGCEETSALIAMSWAKGEKEISKEDAKKEILAIADFEKEKYGTYRDTSASDTIARILEAYFDYHAAELKKDIEINDIIAELEKGNSLIVPCDGQKLKNPFFTVPGPDRHMLVIIGYDYETKEFITNDPGTRQGKSFRYPEERLYFALRDYPSGEHLPIIGESKVMIVLVKSL